MNPKEILMKAVQCDREGRILQAAHHYKEGIEILMNIVKDETDVGKKKVFFERITEYMNRAEQIKERVKSYYSQGELVAHIPIDENDTGYSYKILFGKYITSDIKEVLLEESFLRKPYQFRNLVAFIELLVKGNNNLKFISITTKTDTEEPSKQSKILEEIKNDLDQRGITLIFKLDANLHDRKIFLSNGFIIKIGRGLDIFKPTSSFYSLGLSDYEFRKCLKTDVDIWRTKKIS